jgi:hypothetical protein
MLAALQMEINLGVLANIKWRRYNPFGCWNISFPTLATRRPRCAPRHNNPGYNENYHLGPRSRRPRRRS